MKKHIFKFSIILLLILSSFSCKYISDVCYYYEIFLKNCTDQTITISIMEDPETVTSKKYGACSFTKSVKSGKTVNSKAVVNDYYKILVNGNVIHPQNATEEDKKSDYYLITGSKTVVQVYRDNSGYYFKCVSDFLE